MRFVSIIVMVLVVLAPLAVWAQDKVRDPLSVPLKTYAAVLGAALLGGFVSWYGKVKRGEIPGYSVFHLVGELATAALAGLMCFWICLWLNAPDSITAAATGVCGHMGARAITLFEEFMIRRAKKFLGGK
jgi:heme A synthase